MSEEQHKDKSGIEQKARLEFDPDFTPNHPHNQEVARQRHVEYDPRSEVYRDSDGCLIYDKFGQRL